MKVYASNTGTLRNLTAMRDAGFGLLISRADRKHWKTNGFNDVVGDNGAWHDFQTGQPFNDDEFEEFLTWAETNRIVFRWIVLPDIVAGGRASLDLSMRWMNRCLSVASLVLIAVQDGMEIADLEHVVGPSVGIFLGGTTEWKEAMMLAWGIFCRRKAVHYHVARVNTIRRIKKAAGCFADSIDGSSASKYASTVPLIRDAANLYGRQIGLFK